MIDDCPICGSVLELEFIKICDNYKIEIENKSCHNCHKYFYQIGDNFRREVIGDFDLISKEYCGYKLTIEQKIRRFFAIFLNKVLHFIKL